MTAPVDAFVGLGGNVGDPQQQVRCAFRELDRLPATSLHSASGLYASRPMGPPDQPDYVNAVAWLRTHLDPHGLLDGLQRLEVRAGRERSGERWGPRPLDLDLLLWGERCIRDERLILPHPGVGERAFVLLPLHEIAPGLSIPGVGVVAQRLAAIDRAGVWPLSTMTG